MTKIYKNIILGNGQVTNAIKDHFRIPPHIYDKGEWEGLKDTECYLLHICIPYNEDFKEAVQRAKLLFHPKIVLIHGTVPPGTSKELGASYSPVMGRHEYNFKIDMMSYVKYFAGREQDYKEIKESINLSWEYWGDNTSELEYSKIMSTSFMYWNLIFSKLMHKDCEHEGFDFDKVYKKWNKNYNQGVRPNWQRPIYDYDDNPIAGGHCLGNNLKLYDNFITQLLREWEKNKGELNMISHKGI